MSNNIPQIAQSCNTNTNNNKAKKRGKPTSIETILIAIRLYNYLQDRINAPYGQPKLAWLIGLDDPDNHGNEQIRAAKKWLLDNGYIALHKSKKHKQSRPNGFIQ